MIEFIEAIQYPAIVALAMIITQMIKNQGWLLKVNSRFISIAVSAILVLITKFVIIPEDSLLAIENLLVLIFSSLGYDYLIIPIIDIFRPRSKVNKIK